MTIVVQHETTSIEEIVGYRCLGFIGVGPVGRPDRLDLLFIAFEETRVWHRFYVDAGILFWSPGEYDVEELLEGEVLRDLARELNLKGAKVLSAAIAESVFALHFEDGRQLLLKNPPGNTDGTELVFLTPSPAES